MIHQVNRDDVNKCILLVADDDEDDRLLIADAFRECGFDGTIVAADSGEDVLNRLELLKNDELPSMILLDLNMPRMSGHEVLAQLKKLPEFRKIPVVILTTSSSREDVLRAYDLGGNSFMTKPNTYEGLVDSVRSLMNYWCDVATLPAV
jgi:two-component system response regulator